jgi:hypothetical protein
MKTLKNILFVALMAMSLSSCVVRARVGGEWIPGHYNYGEYGGRHWVPGHYAR